MTTLPTLASRVCAVTVFRRGALVTREAELRAGPDGLPERVQITGLPLTLADSSLQIEVLGTGRLPIASDVRVTIAVPSQDPTLPPPSASELEQAELTLAQAQREFDQLRQAIATLTQVEPGERGEPKLGHIPQASPIAARLELLEFRRVRAERSIERIAELEERKRLASERVSSLRERQRVASQARNVRTHEVRKAVVITLVGGSDEPIRVRLTYFVAGARWAPAYTVRLDRTMSAATLELRAMVGQTSGEDWTNVALTLSTASPQQWTELPELRAQRIGRAQPEPAKTGWRAPPVGAGELYADYDRELSESTRPGRESSRRPAPASAPPVSLPTMVGSRDQAHRFTDDLDEEEPYPEQTRTRSGTISRLVSPLPPRAPSFAPPAPGAMPMQAIPAPQSRSSPKRAAGLGAMLGGAFDSAFGGSGGEEAKESGAGGDLDLDLDLAGESELVAGRELLDYGRLRMFSAGESLRGSLRRIDLRMVYQQVITSRVQFDVAFAQLDVALAHAQRFEAESAPARHRFPTEAGFDYAYVADGTIDLASDGKFHALAIRADEAEATPRYVTVPRESQDVFRIVALRNPLNGPLLPGPADVYVAGRFALTSDVELTPIGGRLELGLGVEQAIKIARNVSYEEDTSGLLKRQHALIHTLAIEVGNNLTRAATVEVRERLSIVPTGLEGDIQVAIREVRPAWSDYEQTHPALEGGRMWTIDVPAGDKRKLLATWVITIPNQHELIGGNRRES